MPGTPVGRMPDDEIKTLARDLVEGRIFTHAHCPPDLLGSVFMPAMLGGFEGVDMESVGAVYEYLDKAGPRAINGCPMFFSMRVVHKDDWAMVLERAEKIDKAMKAAME